MRKFIVSLSLTDRQAEKLAAMWDQANFPDILSRALDEFCIERNDAEHYLFKKFGQSVFDQDWKRAIIEIKQQYQAAKILRDAKVEETYQNDDDIV
jgi:hypothetical protein